MPEQIAISVALPVAVALVSALGILWAKIHKLENKIDGLQRARLEDEKRHSTEIRELAAQVLLSVQEGTSVNRETAKAIAQLAAGIAAQTDILRKCRPSGQHTVPQPQTATSDAETALLPKDHRHG